MAKTKRIANSKQPSGHPLKGKATTGRKLFSGPLMGGSRSGGKRISKTRSGGTGLSR